MPVIEAEAFSGYEGLRQIELLKPHPVLSGGHPRTKAPLVLGSEGAGVIEDAIAHQAGGGKLLLKVGE
jgi:NADPH2:quinone reductase